MGGLMPQLEKIPTGVKPISVRISHPWLIYVTLSNGYDLPVVIDTKSVYVRTGNPRIISAELQGDILIINNKARYNVKTMLKHYRRWCAEEDYESWKNDLDSELGYYHSKVAYYVGLEYWSIANEGYICAAFRRGNIDFDCVTVGGYITNFDWIDLESMALYPWKDETHIGNIPIFEYPEGLFFTDQEKPSKEYQRNSYCYDFGNWAYAALRPDKPRKYFVDTGEMPLGLPDLVTKKYKPIDIYQTNKQVWIINGT